MIKSENKFCKFYNLFGRCCRGDSCTYTHDPKRIAVCQRLVLFVLFLKRKIIILKHYYILGFYEAYAVSSHVHFHIQLVKKSFHCVLFMLQVAVIEKSVPIYTFFMERMLNFVKISLKDSAN